MDSKTRLIWSLALIRPALSLDYLVHSLGPPISERSPKFWGTIYIYIYIYIGDIEKKKIVYVFPLLLKIPKELSIVRDKFFFL